MNLDRPIGGFFISRFGEKSYGGMLFQFSLSEPAEGIPSPSHFGVKLTGVDEDGDRKTSYYLSSFSSQYNEFMDFALEFVPKRKVDEVLFELRKPEILAKRKEGMKKGRAAGILVGLVVIFTYSLFRNNVHFIH